MKKFISRFALMAVIPMTLGFSSLTKANCAQWLDHSFRQLHSTETLDLCQLVGNKPVLIINTASHCGYTYQFKGLEALYQRYKDRGLQVVGFPSNDFRQEANDEAKTAKICYINYGVSFAMASPISVKGQQAHPLFKTLAEKSQAPGWNFTKYLVSADGRSVTHFNSRVEPDSKTLVRAIDAMIED